MKINDKRIQERIIKCAINYLTTWGIKGWNMDQLAANVGVAKNTLYKIVSSKEKLIEKIVIKYIQKNQARMVNIIVSEPDYLVATRRMLEEFPESLFNKISSEHMRRLFLEYPSIERIVDRNQDKLKKGMIAFFKRGIEKGFLRSNVEPELLFQTFRALVGFFIKSGGNDVEIKRKLKEAFDYLINGIKV